MLSSSAVKGAATAPVGQVVFTTAGTFSWTCPPNVFSVCAVSVGPGGIAPIDDGTERDFYPAGGGALGWKNNIPVVPGQTYTGQVGAALNDFGIGRTVNTSATNGDSFFISRATVCGYGGTTYGPGGHVGDGGGDGGFPSTSPGAGAGGGAGGYSGNGGNGASSFKTAGAPGSGGAGGGGATGWTFSDSTYSRYYAGGGGGGVGVYGQGASGLGGQPAAARTGDTGGGKGGSVGQDGQTPAATSNGGNGGLFGGGAGAGFTAWLISDDSNDSMLPGGQPGGGAVRLIWGAGRAFPSTNTGDM